MEEEVFAHVIRTGWVRGLVVDGLGDAYVIETGRVCRSIE